ncbi:hypothetical protein VTJ49DRAFT_6383 [Mycothermus thermophilus]|uniref:Uncharacterized protein n=1 Tax=Humicola insolens TaxID=85995 RepID=A0ABR3VQX6_HUMIN
MAPPPVQPILLFGFCFETQQRLRFNNSWACAFHTSWYTNEDDPFWNGVDDANKRKEIRYGNNICVLFRVLLHCKAFYNHASLWSAIGKGFNTSPTIVKQTAEILTDARRLQRNKPSKEVSDTARAADEWIDFLDNRGLEPTRFSVDPSSVYKIAEAFFKSQDKKLLNASHVPVGYRSSFNPNLMPLPSRSGEEADEVAIKPQSPAITEDLKSNPFPRKRSASPPVHPSTKARRVSQDTRQQQGTGAIPENNKAIDQLPPIKTTKSPPGVNNTLPPRPPPLTTQSTDPVKNDSTASIQTRQPLPPSGPFQATGTTPLAGSAAPPLKIKGSAVSLAPAQTVSSQFVSQSSVSAQTERGSSVSTTDTAPASSVLKEQVDSKEQPLAGPNKPPQTSAVTVPATPATPTFKSRLHDDVIELKGNMRTATNAVTTMMESMHDIVDGMNSIQEEVACLADQQKLLATAITESTEQQKQLAAAMSESTAKLTTAIADNGEINLSPMLKLIEVLTNSVNSLKEEVAELKKGPQQQPPALEALTNSVNSLKEEMAELKKAQQPQPAPVPQPTSIPPSIESHLQAQNAKMDKLFREMAAMRQEQQRLAAVNASTATPQSDVPTVQQPQPQNLRQAMAAAEQDLRRHLGTLQALYYRGGANRALTEKTADFLALLGDGVKAAQTAREL